jgi:hypothetical protein
MTHAVPNAGGTSASPSTVVEFLDARSETDFLGENYPFWGRAVLTLMQRMGPETDPELERLIRIFEDYYSGGNTDESIRAVRLQVSEARGLGFWRDDSVLGRKYRCLNAIATSVSDAASYRSTSGWLYHEWQYGLETAFDLIQLGGVGEAEMVQFLDTAWKIHRESHAAREGGCP